VNIRFCFYFLEAIIIIAIPALTDLHAKLGLEINPMTDRKTQLVMLQIINKLFSGQKLNESVIPITTMLCT